MKGTIRTIPGDAPVIETASGPCVERARLCPRATARQRVERDLVAFGIGGFVALLAAWHTNVASA
jgi:hypothetical protein